MKKNKNRTIIDHALLLSQWNYEKNGNLKPDMVSLYSRIKVWWRCKCEYEWQSTPDNRMKPHGCPKCNGKVVTESNCLSILFPELMKEWHVKNTLKPENLSIGSNRKPLWKCCNCKHEWAAAVKNRTNGHGCPKCGKNLQLTQEEAIKKCIKVHGNRYTYKKFVYINSKTPSIITCRKHGDFEQIPASHWDCSLGQFGHGCFQCSVEEKAKKNTYTKKELKEKFKLIYGNKLDFSKFTKYDNAHEKIPVFCNKHNLLFYKATTYLLKGKNCPKCGEEKRLEKAKLRLKSLEQFKEDCNKVHNDKYDLSEVFLKFNTIYKNAHSFITPVCKKHGLFSIRANDFLKGSGCPICRESKGEKIIRNYLISKKINFKSQVRIKDIGVFDFIVCDNNQEKYIELNGEQHYMKVNFGCRNKNKVEENFEKNIFRDYRKIQYCKTKNAPLLIIPYWDIDKTYQILDDFFAGKCPTFSKPPKEVKNNEEIRRKIRNKLNLGKEILCGVIQ